LIEAGLNFFGMVSEVPALAVAAGVAAEAGVIDFFEGADRRAAMWVADFAGAAVGACFRHGMNR
jgi:hypothetical protein